MPDQQNQRTGGLRLDREPRKAAELIPAQKSMFPLPITNRYPSKPPGADDVFVCSAGGNIYYCKEDRDGRPVRATEWFFTNLAAHLGIATPEPAILEEINTGETFFASRHLSDLSSEIELDAYLNNPKFSEFGGPTYWLSRHLSGVYAFDLFAGNWDRSRRNFLLHREGAQSRLCIFDFAYGSLNGLRGIQFPVENTPTLRVGRFLRSRHGSHGQSAIEMVDRIAAVPTAVIAEILREMRDWLTVEQKEGICELWSDKKIEGRLSALRTGIINGSLL